MIWDCFMFGGERELDLLELRLRTTGPYVDRFVVAESPVTFQGTPKPLAYPDNLERFKPWAAKITYVVVPPITADDSWTRERYQRAYLINGLDDAGPDDTVLMGDLDEIPDLAGWTPPERPEVCILRQHVFAVDWVHNLAVAGTAVIPWRFWLDQDRPPFNVVRELRMKFPRHRWGGWHFSWLGGREAIREKIAAHSHLELNAELAALNEKGLLYEAGWVPWDKVWQMPARVNQTWPEWVRDKDCPASWFRP